ncbi:MBOAT family O-acyltransferase [Leptospira kanakyensis]|uniref:MBOAT family protein n=1 Tax=Leptospira kanakyensis TaxID=2484968 RepID=A0A6N4QKX8_9LEPT|nr:MBOAT family O-acyltransferase [Leptospira kanakyensis]MCW7471180.1 MBOAT family protein [Leptospira kanakyensis]MCW7481915.1 MBOAT family protein [Leptospira kanakyensis]TGK53573.1 MBOAT family protein [Leptospira kanakyensis]TGK57368.1 MBOAT family protein [Leptospira kanakyensis]TGK73079.1 MBOAT family protein [Leptospira kanakyensis]
MKFTSLGFLLFFLVVYCLHWVFRGKLRLGFLFLASLAFYAAWSIPFAFHFFAIVVLNHFFNKQILKNKSSFWYPVSLFVNFGNLFLFKYFYFLWALLFQLTGSFFFAPESIQTFLNSQFGVDSITLPLAISFYTFQMVAYTIDIKRGNAEENPNFLQFALFIFFFPQLVAGPIVRHGEFFYQLEVWNAKKEQLFEGYYLVFLGLFKKVVLADNLSPVIEPVFQNPDQYDGVTNLIAIFGYAARVFCDFSGYTDLARGLGKLLGINLPENFHAPYLSTSVRELWTRWHMTLATWIKDYIYFPLGGSRVSEYRGYVNLIVTFTLAGFWHGANFTFIIWGFLHGFMLSLERKIELIRKPDKTIKLPKWKKISGFVYTFLFFVLSIPFFNAPSVQNALSMYVNVFTGSAGERTNKSELVLYSLILTFLLNYLQTKPSFPRENWSTKTSFGFLLIFSLVVTILLGYLAPGGTEFIYFQF